MAQQRMVKNQRGWGTKGIFGNPRLAMTHQLRLVEEVFPEAFQMKVIPDAVHKIIRP